MTPIARILAAATLLCLLPAQGALAAAYKWVDDKGETHYSQTPPTATDVEVIKTPSGATTYSPPAPAPESGTSAPAGPASDAAKAEDASIRDKNCTIARGNLEALKTSGDVTVKDANGLMHILTADERKARIKEAEKNIKEFCKQ